MQESDGQKTNNGIHYRLQLLYANGKDAVCGRAGDEQGQRLTTTAFPLHVVALHGRDDTESRTI